MNRLRFGVVGLNHDHIYGQTDALLAGGGDLFSFYGSEDDLAARFGVRYPTATRARRAEEILDDPSIQMIATAAIPDQRARIAIEAMLRGKDVMSAKPGATTFDQLAALRRVQAETGRIYSIYFSERFANPATILAGELVHAGAIGRVLQTVGLGPHRSNPAQRPAWFFDPARHGGILTDIASHQMDQFLFFTGATDVRIVAAQSANYRHAHWPEFQDFGEALLSAPGCSGYARVDWLTPDGLPVWGDGRLTILGEDGYIEIRKNCDVGHDAAASRLILVDQASSRFLDVSGVECPYGRLLVNDVLERTQISMPQAHCFLAMELALKAQAIATRMGGHSSDSP